MTIVNGENFTQAQFAGREYLTRLFDLSDALVAVAGAASDDADTVAADKAIVAADKANVSSNTDASENYRDEALAAAAAAQAAAAAAEGGFPFTTTGGTSTAYTANFTPDVTVTDGVSFQLVLHVTNTNTTPTLAVEGGTPYTMVIGVDRRPIPIGMLAAGNSITVAYNATNTEYVIIGGTPLFEFNRNIDARGYEVQNQNIVAGREKRHNLGNVSGALTLNYANGHKQYGTVIGNITSIVLTNWPDDAAYDGWMTVELTQDGTGGRTLALVRSGTTFRTAGGLPITLSADAGAVDKLRFETVGGIATIDVFANLNMDGI